MALRVYVQKGEELVEVWQEAGNHGDRWYLGEVTVNTTGNFQVRPPGSQCHLRGAVLSNGSSHKQLELMLGTIPSLRSCWTENGVKM